MSKLDVHQHVHTCLCKDSLQSLQNSWLYLYAVTRLVELQLYNCSWPNIKHNDLHPAIQSHHLSARLHAYMACGNFVANFDHWLRKVLIPVRFFIRFGLKRYLSVSDKSQEQYGFERTWGFLWLHAPYPAHGIILSGLSASVCSIWLTDRSVNCSGM